MTQSTGERLYRACVRCRKRKTKCDLDSIGEQGKPPCKRCHVEGQACVLAGSRRGGDFSRFRKSKHLATASVSVGDNVIRQDSMNPCQRPESLRELGPPMEPAFEGIQNPLEALRLLAEAAAENREEANSSGNSNWNTRNASNMEAAYETAIPYTPDGPMEHTTRTASRSGLQLYEPVQSGILHPNVIGTLLESYSEHYHPFMPIVNSQFLSPRNIEQTAAKEPFLLSAILMIATKDRGDLEAEHRCIWSHLQGMILAVSLGSSATRCVGAIEALLLLAEWVPHAHFQGPSTDVRGGRRSEDEDSAAWTLVGLAVRQGYLIHLDKYAFRGGEQGDSVSIAERNRLTWTFTYLSDRQISIRMGQAFWCRGPGLSTRFTVDDYPTLKRSNAYEEDFASVLQAQVDLTTLFGNAHDILYASKNRTAGLMLVGDYKKYLDDSIRAMAAWKETWSTLDVSIHLKCMLEILFQYLKLYVSAFAFQAVLCRSANRSASASGPQPRNCFPNGVMASPDGQNIYLAISAAKKVLTHLIERLDPVRHLRYLPARFYLYEIHAVMFLFKAFSYGAITKEEHVQSVELVETFVTKLSQAASSDQHIAFRYSKLLRSLLRQRAPSSKSHDGQVDHSSRSRENTGTLAQASTPSYVPQGSVGNPAGRETTQGNRGLDTDLVQVSPEDTSYTATPLGNQTLWPFATGLTGAFYDFPFPAIGGEGPNNLDSLPF